MEKITIRSPEGEEIELVATSDIKVAEGAYLGAQALLNLLTDELELDSGYEIQRHVDYHGNHSSCGHNHTCC